MVDEWYHSLGRWTNSCEKPSWLGIVQWDTEISTEDWHGKCPGEMAERGNGKVGRVRSFKYLVKSHLLKTFCDVHRDTWSILSLLFRKNIASTLYCLFISVIAFFSLVCPQWLDIFLSFFKYASTSVSAFCDKCAISVAEFMSALLSWNLLPN